MKPGRNDPCPCGSGKKYKQCCLAKQIEAEQSADEMAWRRIRRALDEFASTMLEFTVRTYGEVALDEAWCEFTYDNDEPLDPHTPHASVFFPWLFYRWSPDQGTEVADASLFGVPPARAYLDRKGRHIDAMLRRYLEAALAAPFTYYEILSTEPGRGFRVREFFSGQEFDVREKSASALMHPGDLFFGALVLCDGIVLLDATGACAIPPMHKIELIKLRQHHHLDAEVTDEKLQELDLEFIEAYLAMTDRLLNPTMPELQNTDGDPLAPQTLIFDIDSAEDTFVALRDLEFKSNEQAQRAAAAVDASGRIKRAEITWQGSGNAMHAVWDNTTLGTISIDKKRLRVAVNSDARADKIKQIIESRLGAAARYRVSKKRSMQQMLAEQGEASKSNTRSAEQLDQEALMQHPEVQAHLRTALSAHYDAWVSIPVPALGGLTPMAAVATPDGREMVEALIADIERHSSGQMGFDESISARMRETLGLRK